MTEQPRQPAGAANGGQFAPTEHGDVVVDLPRPVPKGSYLYPPILDNAEDVIAFWEDVDIPDEVCQRVAGTYVTTFQRAVEQQPAGVWRDVEGPKWDAENPKPTQADALAGWERRRAEAEEAFKTEYAEQLRQRPEFLDPRDVRQAAKVIGFLGASAALDDKAEKQKVSDHEIRLTTGVETVGQITRRLGLANFSREIRDPAAYDTTKQIQNMLIRGFAMMGADTDVAIRKTQEQLDEVSGHLDEVQEQIEGTATATIEGVDLISRANSGNLTRAERKALKRESRS